MSKLQEKLQRAVRRHMGVGHEVSALRALTGGAASTTWQFDTRCSEGDSELILRTGAGGDNISTGLDKTIEAQVQSAAVAVGVPAATVLFVLDPEDELGPGYVMQRLPGQSIPQKILRDAAFSPARAIMTAQCGSILAAIHAVDISAIVQLPDLSPPAQIDSFEQLYRELSEPLPIFELAFRWIRQHCPAPQPSRLVHGDFRNGNFLVDANKGITTVLDWELAHRGDPMEDMGWLCVNSWRFGCSDQPVGGFGQREELFAAYHAAGGMPVDPVRVYFWELFGVLKWGIICMQMSSAPIDGSVRSVERAAIGRRVSETEIDLLQLLGNNTRL